MSDTSSEWPFRAGSAEDLSTFVDVTATVVAALEREGILRDVDKIFVDEDDPQRVYVRDLRNVWRAGE